MKKSQIFVFLFLFVGCSQIVKAQGYVKEKLLVYYRSYPMKPLPTEFKTYKSIINPDRIDFRTIEKKPPLAYTESTKADGTVKTNYSSPEQCQKEYLSFPGFELVDQDPDIIITMDFQAIDVKGKENREIDGQLNYDVFYTYGAVLKIEDKNGNLIHKEVYYDLNETKKYVVGPGGFTKTMQDFETKRENEITKKSLEKAEALLKSTYAYTLYYTTYVIATDKTNKKLNYDDLNQAIEITKEAFGMISADEKKKWDEVGKDEVAVAAYCAKLDEAIEIWRKALEEADFNDKKARIHRKLAPMLICNIATAQIFKKDWDGAMEFINMALEYKESEGTAQRLMNFLTSQKERYEINGVL